MSWIVHDLWSSLEARRDEYAALFDNDKIRAFGIISRIAADVGQHYGVVLQLNFPPGRDSPRVLGLGHRDLSVLVYRNREKFSPVSESEVKGIFEQLNPLSFEPLKRDQQGFKVRLSNGRIDCLPGGVHLWCELTPDILRVLDWLFANAYGLRPA
ncbi:hypothetical protein AUH73_08200 [archaeon 13_1_40CM_4_53_4]|nr:MAG: hypothetical protein AUI07_01775 [archaeon 13_2_20CM_2_53_6]OLC61014.1 MAG: hypothetical protein AUH73_08200 [archaeon 13_1_40CM_4_53_4]OLE59553.1 MAG: hypothetical protein AUG17_02025 [Crenarchaeota archaeon 13_1_20CM_2_53_14]TMI24622.1 MAG: hypothetical protein E6H24_06560 [Candidatus Bathyarchaeota archaeon]